MGLVSAGALVGLGQGVQNGVGTIFKARKEQRDQQRLDESERHSRQLEDLQMSRQGEADGRARFHERLAFTEKGGIIKPSNGTEHIGFQVGSSTASTQPSEYDTVGSYGGEDYMLPKDRLAPAERMKQSARANRSVDAATAFPNLHLSPGRIAAMHLEDPENGDNQWNELQRQNFELDPANVENKGKIARAGADARAAASWDAWHKAGGGANGELSAAQKAINARATSVSERSNETQARSDIVANKEPPKADYNYDTTAHAWAGDPNGGAISPDSVSWEKGRNEAFGARTRARMRAANSGYKSDSAMREANGNVNAGHEGLEHLRAAHAAYVEAYHEAKTPEQKAEATSIYKGIEEQILGEHGISRPRK